MFQVQLRPLLEVIFYCVFFLNPHKLNTSTPRVVCVACRKLGQLELWFFITAHPLSVFYLCVKFQVCISNTFRVMLRTRKRDRRTDRRRRSDPYMSRLLRRRRHKNPSRRLGVKERTQNVRLVLPSTVTLNWGWHTWKVGSAYSLDKVNI